MKTIWHARSTLEVKQALETDEKKGLSSDEVATRLGKFGPNALPDQPRTNLVALFIKQFKSPLIYLLLGAALIAFLLNEFSDAFVIFAVVILNSIIGTTQEGRAEKSLESLKRLSKHMVKVRRDGGERTLEARELVHGDILLISAGDAIVADARILSSHELRVSEASLTGESLPIGKTTDILPEETILAERRNMLFSGTFANAGRAVAIVTATGPRTEVGKVARLTTEEKEPPTPLERKVAQFGRMIIFAACGVFLLILGLGWWRGLALSQIFMIGISQVVSMVPEGLPRSYHRQ
ncbi:MAG: HAD-IC family P-type ATPase, partial [Bdellovibrionaceae bacterium]|nr:HAD-IC family P-type ATPase [Pseudobdellovibrionaceae bacterium]